MLVAALLLLGSWLLWGAPPVRPTPAVTPAAASDEPVDTRSGEATPQPPPAAPATPQPTNEAPVSGAATHADEEGMREGGFDPDHPPAGAPDATALQLAFTQAIGYVETINSYGYGDEGINDFIGRAKPYMTPDFYEEWNDIGAIADEQGADSPAWTTYQTTKTRHAARTGTPTVTKWTPTTLELAVPYRTADIPQGTQVPQTATERFARILLVRAGGTWLVQQAATDF